MAKTAAVSLNDSTATAGQRVQGLVTVTNGDTDPIGVTCARVSAGPNTGAIIGGDVPAANVVNGGGATLKIPFNVIGTAPQYAPTAGSGQTGPATVAYVIGATVVLSDGSSISASTATLTCSPPAR